MRDAAATRTHGGMLISLDAKLAAHEEWAPTAVRFLIDWLRDDGSDLIAVARGRHVTGHYRYADANYLEYDADRLLAEAAEELADAINYIARRLALLDEAS